MARFAKLSECDLSCLLAEKDAENTKKATKVSINLFRSYLQEKGLTETEILTSKIKLATVLSLVLSRSKETGWKLLHNGFINGDSF